MLSLAAQLRYLNKSLECIIKISLLSPPTWRNSHNYAQIRNFNQSLSVLNKMSDKKVAIINAKLNKGQGKPGTELGPPALKTPFLFESFENLKYPAFVHTEIVDEEDDNKSQPRPDLRAKNLAVASRTNEKLAKAVIKSLSENYTTVVVGGDHSLAIGSVTGTALALESLSQIGLIWIDAHADINTPLTSSSGNLHGQPVSFLLYELDKYFPTLNSFDWQHPCVTARNLVYIGLRDLDPEETFLINKYKIKTFCMTDVKRLGIHQVVQEAVEHLTINGELLPLHVSVDIDVLDPWFAPSTGTPVMGGLTLDELMFIGNRIHETGKLKTLDLVEVNPLLKDSDKDVEKTVFAAQRAILSFFGYTTLGTLSSSSSDKMTRQRPTMSLNN